MKTKIFIFMSLLLFGCEQKPSSIRILAEKHIKNEELSNGAFRVTFDTPYFYVRSSTSVTFEMEKKE